MIAAGLIAFSLATAAPAMPKEPSRPDLRAELLRMRTVDQDVRQRWIKDPSDKSLGPEMARVDQANTARLKLIVDEVGWPTITMVGEDGATAAWLLVQHADLDRPFQKRCLELMTPLAEAGEASKKDLAYLIDRVRVGEGKPQVYGTQMAQGACGYEPVPIEDADRVEERRAAAGLDSLADNVKRMDEAYGPPSGCAERRRSPRPGP